jgi:hypothetical protein
MNCDENVLKGEVYSGTRTIATSLRAEDYEKLLRIMDHHCITMKGTVLRMLILKEAKRLEEECDGEA